MEFISKYNMTFIDYVNKKYNKKFKDFEQYGLYLFGLNDNKDSKYYYELEKDITDYSNIQQERKKKNGKPKN